MTEGKKKQSRKTVKQMDGQTDMKDGRQSNKLIGRDIGGGGGGAGGPKSDKQDRATGGDQDKRRNKKGKVNGTEEVTGDWFTYRWVLWPPVWHCRWEHRLSTHACPCRWNPATGTETVKSHSDQTTSNNLKQPQSTKSQKVQKQSSHIQIRQLPII